MGISHFSSSLCQTLQMGISHFSGLFVLLCVGVTGALLTLAGEHGFYRLVLPHIRRRQNLKYWLHTSQVSLKVFVWFQHHPTINNHLSGSRFMLIYFIFTSENIYTRLHSSIYSFNTNLFLTNLVQHKTISKDSAQNNFI